MGKEAKIISVEIKSEDGINKIYLTCQNKFGHNVQAVLYNPAGDFSIPLPDDFVTLIPVVGSGSYIAIGNLNNITGVEKGEKKLYSRAANGTLKASIYLDKTGNIILDANSSKVKIDMGDDGKLQIDTDLDIDLNATTKVTINGSAIELNGDSKTFVTYSELNTALQTMVGVANGLFLTSADNGVAGGGLTLNISASETTTIKTGG